MTEHRVDLSDGVYRRAPLPLCTSRGRLLVPEAIALATARALQDSRGDDGPHEGIVLWAGRVVGADVLVASAIVPHAEHTWGSVRIGHAAVGAAARAARAVALVIVAQIHSHPGSDTRHSDGDDAMILLPHEGMFSVVVGNYGAGGFLAQSVGVHQFQNGRWVAISDNNEAMLIIPSSFGYD